MRRGTEVAVVLMAVFAALALALAAVYVVDPRAHILREILPLHLLHFLKRLS